MVGDEVSAELRPSIRRQGFQRCDRQAVAHGPDAPDIFAARRAKHTATGLEAKLERGLQQFPDPIRLAPCEL